MPKISVIVRKCYGAGLYAMCGPAFEPDAALALPQAQIAIMGPEPAVNAVYYNKIMELPESERAAWVAPEARRVRRATSTSTSSPREMLIDDIVPGSRLRAELIKRLAYAESQAPGLPAPPQRRLSGLDSEGASTAASGGGRHRVLQLLRARAVGARTGGGCRRACR